MVSIGSIRKSRWLFWTSGFADNFKFSVPVPVNTVKIKLLHVFIIELKWILNAAMAGCFHQVVICDYVWIGIAEKQCENLSYDIVQKQYDLF